MMRKRLLCVALTLAMLFSMQSAAAATGAGNTRSTVITATLTDKEPTIKVTVPATAEVILNPLRLPVSIDSKSSRQQIVFSPCVIASESDVPLQVNVTVVGEINEGSNMSLTTSSTKNSVSTSKRAFIYFEMQSADSEDLRKVTWDSAYTSKKHIPVTTMKRTKTNMVTLANATLDGEIAEKGGYAAFRLTGDAIVAPKKPWTEDDGLTVEIAFTFVPLPLPRS